jgi:hypothetical protein
MYDSVILSLVYYVEKLLRKLKYFEIKYGVSLMIMIPYLIKENWRDNLLKVNSIISFLSYNDDVNWILTNEINL